MLRTKGGFISKPSKASLKSRGISSNAAIKNRHPGSNESSLDRQYSLYSTDSEDNEAVGVYKGLDKCAQLLTNILEVNGEKEIEGRRQQHPHNNTRRTKAVHKNKKTTTHLGSKTDIKKTKCLQPKRIQKSVIHIPTTKVKCNQELLEPTYNNGVVASTPVLTPDQRKRQELQHRENVLQQQIDLLQEQYENLQKDTVGECAPDSEEAQDNSQELLENKKNESDDVTRSENRSARKSLEFTTNAEKPFIDNDNMTNKKTLKPNEAKKKVRIAKETQETNMTTHGTVRFSMTDVEKSPGQASDRHDVFGVPPRGKEGTMPMADILQQRTPQKYIDHLRILTYLVGELKSVIENLGDVEVDRLLMEIENEIRLLSYPMQSPVTPSASGQGKQHDIDTEIALQPLRSENSDLRRKLRIANQRFREIESQCRQNQEKTRQNPPSESLIVSLHNQLLEEREKLGKETQQKELAEKKLSEHVQERKRAQFILSEKEEEILTINEELRREKEKKASVISQMKLEVESSTISLHAREKEVALLNLALKQRDTEIERLTELTNGLQQSLTKVLTNVQGLHPDDVISEMSSLHSFIDTWQPPGVKDLSLAPNNESPRRENDEQEPREYDKSRQELCVPTVYNRGKYGQPVYDKSSPDVTRHDSVSLLSSSGEESVFKQELANLDTAIARLQDNLRGKL